MFVGYQGVYKQGVRVVHGIEDFPRRFEIGSYRHQVFSELLANVSNLHQICRAVLLLERGLSVQRGEVGGRVAGGGRHKDKVLDALELVRLAHNHQVETELSVPEQDLCIMGLSQEVGGYVEIASSDRIPI